MDYLTYLAYFLLFVLIGIFSELHLSLLAILSQGGANNWLAAGGITPIVATPLYFPTATSYSSEEPTCSRQGQRACQRVPQQRVSVLSFLLALSLCERVKNTSISWSWFVPEDSKTQRRLPQPENLLERPSYSC